MFLLGALCVLLAAGVWLCCLVHVLLTPGSGCRHLPKPAWLAVVALTLLVGAIAWLLLGRPLAGPTRFTEPLPLRRNSFRPDGSHPAALARSRHPAGRRARPIGPDDDPGFLLALDRLIRGGHDAGNDF